MARVWSPQESSPPFVSSSDVYSTNTTPELQFISDRKCRHDNDSSGNRAGEFLLPEGSRGARPFAGQFIKNARSTNLRADLGRSECLLPCRCWESY